MRFLAAFALILASAFPCFAQSTAIGVGEANSQSISGSRAIASNVFNTPANTTNSTRVSGTQTLRNVPSVQAPGLAAAGIETCLGSVSGGVAFPGGGFTFGSTTPDRGCDTRLDARTLWAFGLKPQAVARLCQKEEMSAALGPLCGVRPAPVAYGGPPVVTASASPSGGIWLIEGRTKRERYCLAYDDAARRCRQWQ
jgi:hypothetical protein